MIKKLKTFVGEYQQILKPVKPSVKILLKRLEDVERDIMIPIKGILILILGYYLFFSQLLTTVTPMREVALHSIQRYFIFYVIFNAIMAGLLIVGEWRRKLIQLRWLLFLNGVFDAVLLAILTLVTGGYSSTLYWLFVGLILRNALVLPGIQEQVTLNILICFLYIFAGTLDIKIRDIEANAYIQLREAERALVIPHSPKNKHQTNYAKTDVSNTLSMPQERIGAGLDENTLRSLDLVPPENPAEPVALRTILLFLLTVCFYGLQLLLLRNQIAQQERRQFDIRSQQLRSASRIAGEIAHQIKNPLAIINNSAFMLQRSLKDAGASIQRQVQIIRDEVVKADKIVTELLGYARLAEGKVEKLNVLEVLDSSIETVFPPGSGYEVQINKTYMIEEPFVMMQENHLRAIFVNILQNAREAMEGSGKVDIVVSKNSDDNVEVSIADSGPGIPPDKINRVFEPFFTTKATGTGLGLAIVRQNLDIYGGSVRVESESGRGAKFIIVLPSVKYEAGE
jgi:signal transduction histidine kinase